MLSSRAESVDENEADSTGTVSTPAPYSRRSARNLYLVPPLEDDRSVAPSVVVDEAAARLFDDVAIGSVGWARNTALLAERLGVGSLARHTRIKTGDTATDAFHNISLIVRVTQATFESVFDSDDFAKPSLETLSAVDIRMVASVTRPLKNREILADLEDEI